MELQVDGAVALFFLLLLLLSAVSPSVLLLCRLSQRLSTVLFASPLPFCQALSFTPLFPLSLCHRSLSLSLSFWFSCFFSLFFSPHTHF